MKRIGIIAAVAVVVLAGGAYLGGSYFLGLVMVEAYQQQLAEIPDSDVTVSTTVENGLFSSRATTTFKAKDGSVGVVAVTNFSHRPGLSSPGGATISIKPDKSTGKMVKNLLKNSPYLKLNMVASYDGSMDVKGRIGPVVPKGKLPIGVSLPKGASFAFVAGGEMPLADASLKVPAFKMSDSWGDLSIKKFSTTISNSDGGATISSAWRTKAAKISFTQKGKKKKSQKWQLGPFDADIALKNLDRDTLLSLVDREGGGDPTAKLFALLTASPKARFDIRQIDLKTPHGRYHVDGYAGLKNVPKKIGHPMMLLGSIDAELNGEIPHNAKSRKLLGQEGNAMITQAQRAGLLKKGKNKLTVQATYKRGVTLVNGKPFNPAALAH